MVDKVIVNCKSGDIFNESYTESDLLNIESLRIAQEEQKLLDKLNPGEKDLLLAEVEIQTITILMEVGLI